MGAGTSLLVAAIGVAKLDSTILPRVLKPGNVTAFETGLHVDDGHTRNVSHPRHPVLQTLATISLADQLALGVLPEGGGIHAVDEPAHHSIHQLGGAIAVQPLQGGLQDPTSKIDASLHLAAKAEQQGMGSVAGAASDVSQVQLVVDRAAGTHQVSAEENRDYAYEGVQAEPGRVKIVLSIVLYALGILLLIFELCNPVKPWSKVFAEGREGTAGAAGLPKAKSANTIMEKVVEDDPCEEDIKVDPDRWCTLGLILLSTCAFDLCYLMSGTFFQGEADKVGLGALFGGVYLGGAGASMIIAPPVVAWALQYMNACDVMRMGVAAFVCVTIPQGLGNLMHNKAAFVCFYLGLRFVEGACVATVETAAGVLVLRTFQRKSEYAPANGILISVRTVLQMMSPVVGGALYDKFGMWGPFTAIGFFAMLSCVFMRCFLRLSPAAVSATRNAPMSALFSIPAFVAMLAYSVTVFLVFAGFEVLWQPWVGLEGTHNYHFTPGRISYLGLIFAGSMAVGAMTLGMAIISKCGNLAACLVGNVGTAICLLFVGNDDQPPTLIPGLPVLDWIPFALIATLGLLSACQTVAFSPLLLEVVATESEYSRKQTSAPLACILTSIPAVGSVLGPLLGGLFISQTSAAGGALFLAATTTFGAIILLVSLSKYWCVKAKYWMNSNNRPR